MTGRRPARMRYEAAVTQAREVVAEHGRGSVPGAAPVAVSALEYLLDACEHLHRLRPEQRRGVELARRLVDADTRGGAEVVARLDDVGDLGTACACCDVYGRVTGALRLLLEATDDLAGMP